MTSKHLNNIIFLQRAIKKFLLKKKGYDTDYKKNHKQQNSFLNKNDIGIFDENFLNNNIKYVENLRVGNVFFISVAPENVVL